MNKNLTKKQALILDFISNYINTHGVSPTYREIMSALGLSSVSAVAEHIDNLVKKNVLRKNPGAARSLEVIDWHLPEVQALFEFKLESCNPKEAEILRKAADILGLELNK